MAIPDWQLPAGVDRGLWDYLHAAEMVAGYDEQMQCSALATADVAFCERAFATPGRLIDLGCGTGRLCVHFSEKGHECLGVDLSDEMLAKANELAPRLISAVAPKFVKANIVERIDLPEASFDHAACLFSTLGMVRGAENRAKVIANAFRLLKPGGQFVLHVHNRYFHGLGWKRVIAQRLKGLFDRADAGDITMPQAYGGAPLTLHHFTHREAVSILESAGFVVKEVAMLSADGAPAENARIYGWLFLASRERG